MTERPEKYIIDNPEANRLLNDIKTAKKLLPFFLKPKNLGEAASELKVEPNSLYYWVKKFLKLNILIISHKKQRAGSSIIYYVTPAKILILKADIGMCSIKDYFGQAVTEYNEAIREGIVESLAALDKDVGIMLSNNGRGALQTRVAILGEDSSVIPIRDELLKTSSPAAFATWNHLRLKHEDAKELQHKLSNLLEEFEQKSVAKRTGYYIQLAIVPEVRA